MKETHLLPQYLDVLSALRCGKEPILPAEIHGYLVGVVCGSSSLIKKGTFEAIINEAEEVFDINVAGKEILVRLMLLIFQQLQNIECEFQLLLPDDEQSLSFRIEALARWCENFLTGLGITGIQQDEIDTGQLFESLHDITEIAKINYLGVPEEEANEAYYTELVEYIRAAVILIYIENVAKKEISWTQTSDTIQ